MNQFFKPFIDFDHDLEGAVLGICLIEPFAFGKVQNVLLPECFNKREHAEVYNAIFTLYDQGWPIDYLLVQRFLYDKGLVDIDGTPTAYLMCKLMENVVSSAHLEVWAVKLRELAIRRTAIMITNSGIDRSTDVLEMAGDIELKLKQLMDLKSTDDWEDGSKVAMRLLSQMEATARGDAPTITTSLRELDMINGGFKAGQLVLLAARPGVGKSAFMGRMAIRAARAGKQVGVISLEMDSSDVFARMVSFDTDTPFWRMDLAVFSDAQQHTDAIKNISDTAALPIHFSDRAQVSMRDVRAKAERLKKKHGLDILFIDYLQLIEGDASKIREQQVAKMSVGCKQLARTLKIPIVLLAQLNRQASDGEPELKHLRESGSLEQDADIVFMLHRDDKTEDPALKDTATLFVRKWRNGKTPNIKLHFVGEHMRFSEESEVETVFSQPFDKPNSTALTTVGQKVVDFTRPKSETEEDPF